jgi:purine-binding chemotaxis protein CheW
MKNHGGKYLTFFLAEEQYGICISLVREIIGMMPVTPIPRTPDYVKGVVNLRGRVVPVVDLRQRLELPLAELTEKSCIIVAEIDRPTEILVIGLLVDAVAEVLNIRPEDITPPPDFGANIRIEYIRGIARTENSVRVLLDIQRIISDGDRGNPDPISRSIIDMNRA